MRSRRPTVVVVALFCATTLGACYQRRLEPLRPLAMQLRSPTPVLLTGRQADGAVATSVCEALKADVQVEQIRGDTLFYASLSNRRSSRMEKPCGTVGPGFIVLTAHPNITAVVATKSNVLTSFAVPVGALVGAGILFTALLLGGIFAR